MTGHSIRSRLGTQVLSGAAAALGLGTFLPWLRISAPFLGTSTKAGIEGDGQIVLVVAVGLGVLAYLSVARGLRNAQAVGVILLAVISGGILLYDGDRVGAVATSSPALVAALDTGWYLCLVASMAAIAAAILFIRENDMPFSTTIVSAAPSAVTSSTVNTDIERLAALHERGVLTDEEFTAKKKQVLGL